MQQVQCAHILYIECFSKKNPAGRLINILLLLMYSKINYKE